MNRKNMLIIGGLLILIVVLSLGVIRLNGYRKEDLSGSLVRDLEVVVDSSYYVSDFIADSNIKITSDYMVDTREIGDKEIIFYYTRGRRKYRGSFNIRVVDETSPLILLGGVYTVTLGYDKELTDVILCGDNYDKSPLCEIEGEYDVNRVGDYPLVFRAVDGSGNESKIEFKLRVVEPKAGGTSNKSNLKFSTAIDRYKTSDTKIGIDVSKWQGDIDFAKLKEEGVEFVIIRVGTQEDFYGDNVVDPYFEQNIKGVIEAGIPVGVYYHSYASSVEEARSQARWVISMIKDYKIDLPVAFDWESFTSFNSLDISLRDLNEIARVFMEEIEKDGYRAMNYGSKSYLETIWTKHNYDTWLAHYTSKTDYSLDYLFWQLSDTGKVNGIDGYVDIDVMYLDRW